MTRIFSLAVILGLLITACTGTQTKNEKPEIKMSITKQDFGKVGEIPVDLYTLKNLNGLIVKITNYGGIITEIITPDKNGEFANIVLGFDNLQQYLDGHPYFGAIVGRCGNRIAKGKFTLDGQEYTLAQNNGENHLHGGISGFDKKVWDATMIEEDNRVGLKLSYLSKDGEEGYPGNLLVTATYWLDNNNELKIDYEAVTDKASPINITSHSYFNLKDAGASEIFGHEMKIDADKYTVVSDEFIPTGELRDVEGTPFDFREKKTIGQDFGQVEGGYDHNFVLNNEGSYKKVVKVFEPESGRIMEVFTDQPGVQFYVGNFLDGSLTGLDGAVYNKNNGFCLETQHFPDSPNQPGFPSTILRPGTKYTSSTSHKFSVGK